MNRPTRKQLLNACEILVRCWDRAETHVDFAQQAGAHIEDMRDMVRADMRLAASRADRQHAAEVRERRGDQQERQACQS